MEREAPIVLEYQSRAIPWSVHINVLQRNMDFSLIFGLVFILTTKNWQVLKRLVLAGVASIIIIYYPVNFAVQYFQTLGLKVPPTGPGSIGERFGETFDENNLALMSESGRFFYINKGFEVFKDIPMTGTGFGSFGGSADIVLWIADLSRIMEFGRISTAASISTRTISTFK